MPMVSGGESGAGDEVEMERADAEVRQFSEQELQDKEQRAQDALAGEVAARLPDRGRKLRVSLAAIRRELARREAHRVAPRPHGGGGTRVQDDDGCERIVRPRCAESSGLASDSNKSKVTIADFQSYFGMDKKTGAHISSSETRRSPNEPNTLVENEGKLCEEKESCKTSLQPTNSSHRELCLDNSINMKKISADDASKDNGHNRMWEPSSTPSRKRKGAAPANFSMRLRSRKGEVVLLDGDTNHPEAAEETSNNWDAGKLYYPSRDHPNSVEMSTDDIRCLQPESLLSSPIMNFYIMYLQGPMSSIIRPRGEYHIFNTYFFSKLEALTSKEDKTTCFLNLRRWWKGVDIFQKAYVLLPVHAETHWSLVIVCMPAKEDQTGPIILHLDSLKFHSSRLIFNVVSRFLKEEWNYLNANVSLAELPLRETVWKKLPCKIEKKTIEVPQQENDFDCGLFVLYYMQRFIQEAPERLQKKDLSMFGKGWFRPEEPSHLRLEIRRLLQSCGETESKNDATEPSCAEAESNNDATKPPSENLSEAVDVTAEKLSASFEENCRSG
ncbi:ubiquitin-like-specific protease 1D [Phragmites australis]|uniref:ubiquitin-like-specific protease 1D n=1 Tax=Phragmites australis TaxID=29695 RepID=UPI002D77D2C0|nr:ubiquitin-like-specific protease 1D [Phragmites australis]